MNNKRLIQYISILLDTSTSEINNVRAIKNGLTNRSWYFECGNNKYIIRIPGEEANKIINRSHELAVYDAIRSKGVSEEIVYMNAENGCKIAKFYSDARVCNAGNELDVKRCMKTLKTFHDMKLQVMHEFNLFEKIIFYEKLKKKTHYSDYTKIRENIFSLKKYINLTKSEYCLTHIDAVPDNFLILNNGEVKLIDWEYAAMQDPHVDVAMFALYSCYTKDQIDTLIDIYFNNNCPNDTRIKVYCYVAICGFMWSNWCEYKENFGIDFGEYADRQYEYAKLFFDIVKNKLN